MKRNRFAITLLVCLTLLALLHPAGAIKLKWPKLKVGGKKVLDKVVKGVGIVFLVRQFGGALNNFINAVLVNRGAENRQATRVVPILTFGRGTEAGACQVSGPAGQVSKVRMVLALGVTLDKGHRFKIQALVPTSSLNPTKLQRVQRVGISAIIDYRL